MKADTSEGHVVNSKKRRIQNTKKKHNDRKTNEQRVKEKKYTNKRCTSGRSTGEQEGDMSEDSAGNRKKYIKHKEQDQ